jgi:hypothetical protein
MDAKKLIPPPKKVQQVCVLLEQYEKQNISQ